MGRVLEAALLLSLLLHSAAPALAQTGDNTHVFGDGDGPDILPLALLTIGAALAAGFVALLITLVRIRLGIEAHKPPEGSEADPQSPH